MPMRISKRKANITCFPLAMGRGEARAQEQGVKYGVEFNPGDISVVILLGRQDFGNKVVPVEEPLIAKDVKDLKN